MFLNEYHNIKGMHCYNIRVTCDKVKLKGNNPNYIGMQIYFIGLHKQKKNLKEESQAQSKI